MSHVDYTYISTFRRDKVTLKKCKLSWVSGDFLDLIALDPKTH